MRVLSAHVSNFRNIESAKLVFSEGVTALIGPNGQGKTNLIEALYCVAALRPLRSVTRANLIRSGESKAEVDLKVHRGSTGLEHQLYQGLSSGGRHLRKDGKACTAKQILGTFTVVAFTPDDLEISKGSPDLRRKFVDRAILNTRPAYLETALAYSRAVKSRNKLLADDGDENLLDAYDESVAQYGAKIVVQRKKYAQELGPDIIRFFEEIAQPCPKLSIEYASSIDEIIDLDSVENTAEKFVELLHSRRQKDRWRKTTSKGPHLDDLKMSFDGTAMRTRASQGQHRALVLAIKLAEIVHLERSLGEAPVLLLDDISSELDAVRSEQLFLQISALNAQLILTTTHESQIPSIIRSALEPTRIYDVHGGKLSPRA
jgi:DNA replication and repair protein RecF